VPFRACPLAPRPSHPPSPSLIWPLTSGTTRPAPRGRLAQWPSSPPPTSQARLPPLPPPRANAHEDALAPLLPAPLYTLWHGAAAYLEAWGGQRGGQSRAGLAVVGDAAAARRVQRTGLQPGDEGAPAAAEASLDAFEAHPLRVALRLDGGLEAGRATRTLALLSPCAAAPYATAPLCHHPVSNLVQLELPIPTQPQPTLSPPQPAPI